MKILVALYPLNDNGGIINSLEDLVWGFKQLGHSVEARLLVWKDEAKAQAARRPHVQQESEIGDWITYDQHFGWVWPSDHRFAYKGKAGVEGWKGFANQYDMVLWHIAVPTHQKENRGNHDWLGLYDLDVPQVAHIHDGNLEDYPWLYAVAHKFAGVAAVHPCAYHGLARFPVRRAMVPSPQARIEQRMAQADATARVVGRGGWLSLQTFKGWKHVEDVVRAVPYMGPYNKWMAGGGINRYYMTSKDKQKDQFTTSTKYDPNLMDNPAEYATWCGRPIWDRAEVYGMEYLNYLSNEQRDETLAKVRLLIDPSWSHRYAKVGDHFNRVIVDAIIAGAVPVARDLGVSTNYTGIGELFIPGVNYQMIPWNVTPKEFAAFIDHYHFMSDQARDDLVGRARTLLPYFDARVAAQSFIDLANGKAAGYYGLKGDKGKMDPELKAASDRELTEFFGA